MAVNLNSTSMTANALTDTATPNVTTEVTISGPVPANHLWITMSLTCANNSTVAVPVTVNRYDGTNIHRSSVATVVAPNATFEACPSRKFLQAGWSLKMTIGTASAIDIIHDYLDCF